MRENLFRGKGDKRYNDGVWYFGVPIECYDGDWQICTRNIRRTVIPETIGQCTELLDKNRKKIFEGDIVTGQFQSKKITGYIKYGTDGSFYIYRKGLFGIGLNNADAWLAVIGNIYDNPELIGGETNG